MNILIIPDIHGRTFWKEAVEKHNGECGKMIFLGDYLDPYPWEGITRKDAIRNLDEIIEFKTSNKDSVILLLGNHDLPYVDKRHFFTRSRYDSSNAYHIEEMFKSHKSLFQLAHEELVGGKRYLFTHSGLIPQWYERNQKLIGELTAESLNSLKEIPNGITALCEVSRYRGGYDRAGSIVWADIHEMMENTNDDIPWEYQIFGHTQQLEHPVITKKWACLDCRKAFVMNEEGGFKEA